MHINNHSYYTIFVNNLYTVCKVVTLVLFKYVYSDDDSSFGLFLCLLKVPYGKQTEEQGTTDPMDTKDILIVLMHTGTISLELHPAMPLAKYR